MGGEYYDITIEVAATDSEWNEIKGAIEDLKMPWFEVVIQAMGNKRIRYLPRYGMDNKDQVLWLSQDYPSVLFRYKNSLERVIWICNGESGKKREIESYRKSHYLNDIGRFISATSHRARGLRHDMNLMPDGKVVVRGENRFGECEVWNWTDIRQVSCGNWHSVGLRGDGTVVACGSNYNGQCDVGNLGKKAIAISCGRYHTAILLEDGRVTVKGKPEQEIVDIDDEMNSAVSPTMFPLIEEVGVMGSPEVISRTEILNIGEEVVLNNRVSEKDLYRVKVMTKDGVLLGVLINREHSLLLAPILKSLKATVVGVKPLSKRSKTAKYPLLRIQLEYKEDARNATKPEDIIGAYPQKRYYLWPPVKKILSIFDAVIGVTEDDQIFIDGFCPYTEKEIYKVMGITRGQSKPMSQTYDPANPKLAPLDEAIITYANKRKEMQKRKQKEMKMWLDEFEDDLDRNVKIHFPGSAFVFTGLYLEGVIDDKEHPVVKKVVGKGGIFRTKVSGKTDYLVVAPEMAGANKMYDALEYIEEGKNIKIILMDDLIEALK